MHSEAAKTQAWLTLLHVRLPPTVVDGPLEDKKTLLYFQVGEKVVLICKTTGVPAPTVYWYKSHFDENTKDYGTNLVDINAANKQQSDNGTLTISSMFVLDAGVYHCAALNKHGRAMSISAKIERAVLGRIPPSEYFFLNATEGEPLVVACGHVKCEPPPVYRWELTQNTDDNNSRSLQLSERITLDPEGFLYFANVKAEDERDKWLYKCMITNRILDTAVGGNVFNIKVERNPGAPNKAPQIVYPKPSGKKTVIAVFGEELQLKCIFTGKPAPQVSWKKVRGYLQTDRYKTEEFNTKLRITNTQWSDEGDYECTGYNSEGIAVYVITVDVQSRPTFVDTVLGKWFDLNITEGETAKFYCEADPLTEPAPQITFINNGIPLPEDHGLLRREIEAMGDGRYGKIFTIKSVCKECPGGGSDLMGVQCLIKNTHGVIFKSGYLNVLFETQIVKSPDSIELTPAVIDAGEIAFECQAKADDSTPVKIHWLRDGQVINVLEDPRMKLDEQNTLHINIKGLEMQGEEYVGTYGCRADNGYSAAFAEAHLEMAFTAGGAKNGGLADTWWYFVIITFFFF